MQQPRCLTRSDANHSRNSIIASPAGDFGGMHFHVFGGKPLFFFLRGKLTKVVESVFFGWYLVFLGNYHTDIFGIL